MILIDKSIWFMVFNQTWPRGWREKYKARRNGKNVTNATHNGWSALIDSWLWTSKETRLKNFEWCLIGNYCYKFCWERKWKVLRELQENRMKIKYKIWSWLIKRSIGKIMKLRTSPKQWGNFKCKKQSWSKKYAP